MVVQQQKNETQASDKKLKTSNSNLRCSHHGDEFNRINGKSQKQKVDYQEKVEQEREQKQISIDFNPLTYRQQQTEVAAAPKNQVLQSNHCESEVYGESTGQMSEGKSSMLKYVSQDVTIKGGGVEYPKMSIQSSIVDNQKKPFKVTICNLPAQEVDIIDSGQTEMPVRRCTEPFDNHSRFKDHQIASAQILDLQQQSESYSPSPNSFDSGNFVPKLHLMESLPQALQLQSKQVLCSPKSANRLLMQKSLLRPAQKIRLEQAGLIQDETNSQQQIPPASASGSRPFRRSNNTNELLGMENILGSAQSIGQIKKVTSRKKSGGQRLPQDKSTLVQYGNMLPTSIKYKTSQREALENPTMGQQAFLQHFLIEKRQQSMLTSPRLLQQQSGYASSKTQSNQQSQIIGQKPRTPGQVTKPFRQTQGAPWSHRVYHSHRRSGTGQNQVAPKSSCGLAQRAPPHQPVLPIQRTVSELAREQAGENPKEINQRNLSDRQNQAGSRMPRHETDVLNNHGSIYEEDGMLEVATAVKEWLTSDQYRDLAFKKHAEVLSKRRLNRHETYRGKQQLESPLQSPVRININQHISDSNDSLSKLRARKTTLIGKDQMTTSLNELPSLQLPTKDNSQEKRYNLDQSTLKDERTPDQSPILLSPNRGAKKLLTLIINQATTDEDKKSRATSDLKPDQVMQTQNLRTESLLVKANIIGQDLLRLSPTAEAISQKSKEFRSSGREGHLKNLIQKGGISQGINIQLMTQQQTSATIPSLYQQRRDHKLTVLSQKQFKEDRSSNRQITNRSSKSKELLSKGNKQLNQDIIFRVPALEKPTIGYRNSDMQAQQKNSSRLASPIICQRRRMIRKQDTVKIGHQKENDLNCRSVQSELSNMQLDDEEVIMPAPLISTRNALLDSQGSSTQSPSRIMNDSCKASTSLEKRLRNRAHLVEQSLDTDRKDLVNCLLEDDMSPAINRQTKVLTRLLKGQDPNASFEMPFALNLQEVTCLKKTQIESKANLLNSVSNPLTLLFHLNTLYSTQARAWQKYDEQWDFFEKDHLKTAAPIPLSSQFLLVHLIQQLKKQKQDKSNYRKIKEPCSLNQKSEVASKISLESTIERNKTHLSEKFAQKLKNIKQKLIASSIPSPSTLKVTKQQNRVVTKGHGSDQVTLKVLDKAFRLAKIRLQMAQTSVLFKFNDDDRRIFSQFRNYLNETYEKIKTGNSCIH